MFSVQISTKLNLFSLLFFVQVVFAQPTKKVSQPDVKKELQTPDPSLLYFGSFEKGDIAYTLATDISLRDKTEFNANVLTKLPIATPVKIEEVLEKTSKQHGFRAPWYRISYNEAGTRRSGFVWGGLLTQTIVRTKQIDGVIFLMGIVNADSSKQRVRLQVRAARDGKEVSKIEYDAATAFKDDVSSAATSFGGLGLKDVNDALVFSLENEQQTGQHLLFWNGKQLIDGCEITTKKEKKSSLVAEFIFPTQKGGKPQTIVLNTTQTNYDDNGVEKKSKKKTSLLKWNGRKLIK